MLNAVGLQNPGYELFAKRDIPYLQQFDTNIIVNVCGRTTEDYIDVVEKLGIRSLIYHTYCYGFHCRTGKSAGFIC